ncbi:GldG family protein [Lachnoclostridium sp.]|uniref:GldG family protein n=1 Tax=Lachnoclostridium sp. TaxID=2028282 RepID=UPI00289CAAED|nr:GldG family protein [Lachnoclostridium sp.]
MSEKREHNLGKKIKSSFQSRKFKGGAYATIISSVVIVIVLLINLFVQELGIKKDLTEDDKYSLTEETKDFIKNINHNITIYYLVESGGEIDEFKRIVDNYDNLNSKVSVKYKDPVQYPKFASQYVEDEIGAQSFLVVNEDTNVAKYIPYQNLFDYEINSSTYQYDVTGLKVEEQIDAAISFVTNEDLPTVYTLTGHGEASVTSYLSGLYKDNNITATEFSSLTAQSVPEDCDVLLINMPQYDLTEEETAFLKDYLAKGGDAIFFVDYVTNSLPNVVSLLNYYGVDVVDGLVVEGDSQYTISSRYPTLLVPKISSHEFVKNIKDKKYIVVPVGSGLAIRNDLRDTIETNTILKTSDKAYSKINVNSTVAEKEENDIPGPFILGLEVKEAVGEKETRIAVYTGKAFLEDQYLKTTSFGNADLIINTINAMSGQENALSIRSTSLDEPMVSMNTAQKDRIGLVTVVLLPLFFLATGITVVVRRRRK